MVWLKRVNNSDSGDSTHWGGDHLDTIDKYFDNTDVSGSLTSSTTINTNTTFRNGKLFFRNSGNTFSYNLKAGTITQDIDVNLPSASGNITLLATGGATDWGDAMQTFRDDFIRIANPAANNYYIFSTGAITANRVISLPVLGSNDTFTFNAATQTLSAKTMNIDSNTFRHSTTNAQGDLLIYDTTAGKYIRLPRGTEGQVLKTVSSDVVWDDESAAPSAQDVIYDNLKTSSGFKYGWYTGVFDHGDAPDRGGEGLFSNFDNIGGTATPYIDTTNGFQGVSYAMTSGTANTGMLSLAPFTIRKLDPDLTVCFQLDEGGDNTGSRIWIGFTDNLSTGSLDDSTYLDNDSGFLLHKRSDETTFQVTHNDGDATQNEEATLFTTDSAVHTIRLFATEASSKWSYSLDGATAVDVTTEIPANTTSLGVVINSSQSDSSSRNFRIFWAKVKMKERV